MLIAPGAKGKGVAQPRTAISPLTHGLPAPRRTLRSCLRAY